MKNILPLLALLLISCNAGKAKYSLDKNAPIVDYNQSYDYYDHHRKIDYANEQTLILFNDKAVSYEKFKKLIHRKKVKSIENIQDKNKIVELGYSYNQVKRIILTKS